MQTYKLKELGFTDKEIEVYVTLLEQGRLTPAIIALSTGIKRPTVYGILKELIKKGVVIEEIRREKRLFSALPVKNLEDIVLKEEREIQYKKTLVHQAIQELESLSLKTKNSIPRITYIYEENIENFLYKQTSVWNESILQRDGSWWGFQDPEALKKYGDWIDWYWKEENTPKQVVLRLLTNQSEFEKRMSARGYNRRLIKFWKGGQNIDTTTWVIGDYVIIVATSQKPYYLVQIYDATLAKNMREMFKYIWETQ